jgi:cytochrome P450
MTFVLAMLNYPEVQKHAQTEIDATIGDDGLPDFQDVSDLPYLSAIVKEVLRFVIRNVGVVKTLPHLVI